MKKYNIVTVVILHLATQNLFGQEVRLLPIHGGAVAAHARITDNAGDLVAMAENNVQVNKLNDSLYYVEAVIRTGKKNVEVTSVDIALSIVVKNAALMMKLKQAFHWVPNIKLDPEQIIAQHVFRSPCVIVTLQKNSLVLVPDLQVMENNNISPYYFDLSYDDTCIHIHYGLSDYTVVGHRYYQKSGKSFSIHGEMKIGFYLLIPNTVDPLSVLRNTNEFFWSHIAKNYTQSYLPQTVSFGKYAEVGYSMALENYWVDVGKNKGGITLSTFYDESTHVYRGRDSKNDLWYQSWFNNMRTAYGMYSWGRNLQHDDWQQKALAIVNLFMGVPTDNGWFPTIYETRNNNWIASGQGGGPDVYHLPDNAWTAYWLLRFSDELKNIPAADKLLLGLSNAILLTQNKDGSFPTLVKVNSLVADTVLNHTASSAIATWYLEEMLLRNKVPASLQTKYRMALKQSLDFLSQYVLPQQRFEDFESYFSCSPKPMHYFDTSTCLYSQNTLSMQWCAEAYLKAFYLFKDKEYLLKGEYCLNILSLYQQVWNPSFINLYAFGGFGAQNTDAEWNDARQAQFAETYLNFYKTTAKKEYLERAIYACRASFALMVLPENKIICPNNYTGNLINGEAWQGSMAENYGHSGYDKRSYQSGFHWGTGSALTTAAIFKQELGDLYMDTEKKIAIGVDGIVVKNAKWGKIPQLTTQRIDSSRRVMIHSNPKIHRQIILDNHLIQINQ